MVERKYLDLLRELSADESSHSGRTLLEHLAGTHDLLEQWKNPRDVCIGGLFHSIYGTESYKIESADLADRKRIADAIGAPAEELAFLFCTTDRTGFFTEADRDAPVLVDRKTKTPVPVGVATLRALIEIEVANYIEQFNPATPANLPDYMRFMLKAGSGHLTAGAQEELGRVLKQFDKNAFKVPVTTKTTPEKTWWRRLFAHRPS